MLTARQQHAATLLRDGHVLVAGGMGADERSTLTAELYDPQSGNWAATGSMVTAISEPIALRLGDGRVLVMSHDGREAQVYDPASGAWRATGNLLQPRSSFTTSLLTDGRVLVIGGSASDAALASAELYDPLSGSWTDAAPMSTPRMSHTATVLADGRVLVVGGSTTTPGAAAAAATNAPSTAESGVLASAELYDPTSNTWTATGALHLARALHAAAPLPDGRVVVLGGTTFVEPTGEAYDQASGNWVIAPRAASWMTPSAIVFRDGRVLLVDSLGSLEFYDPDAPAAWHGPMSSLHGSGASATLLADGRVLFAGGVVLSSPGGYGLRSDHLASAHLLDPGAWSR